MKKSAAYVLAVLSFVTLNACSKDEKESGGSEESAAPTITGPSSKQSADAQAEKITDNALKSGGESQASNDRDNVEAKSSDSTKAGTSTTTKTGSTTPATTTTEKIPTSTVYKAVGKWLVSEIKGTKGTARIEWIISTKTFVARTTCTLTGQEPIVVEASSPIKMLTTSYEVLEAVKKEEPFGTGSCSATTQVGKVPYTVENDKLKIGAMSLTRVTQ